MKKAGADWRSMVPPDIAGILASIRSSLAQRDAMMQQMQQQGSSEPSFPQLDLVTEPPPATPPPAP